MLQNRLAECRAARGIKKSQLAMRLGKSRAYVTRLERGDIHPSAEVMLGIARYFKKPVEEIFQLAEEESSKACLAQQPKASVSKASAKNNLRSAVGRGQEATTTPK